MVIRVFTGAKKCDKKTESKRAKMKVRHESMLRCDET